MLCRKKHLKKNRKIILEKNMGAIRWLSVLAKFPAAQAR